MKAILQSIKPQYCELIAAGKKTIEVRKTIPNIPTPFKVYIYQTKTVYVSKNKDNEFLKPILDNRLGKVIGEYICDEIIEFTVDEYSEHSYCISDDELAETCLSKVQLWDYGKGKTLYGYHISNLVIYDKEKELKEFRKPLSIMEKMIDDDGCWLCDGCPDAKWEGRNLVKCSDPCCSNRIITRPPQSWCYVEKINV